MDRIYLDNNATTQPDASVIASVTKVLSGPLNSSSVHQSGREARQILENARNIIAKSVNANSDYRVIFTSSGTESNNLSLKGFNADKILISAIEHPSIYKFDDETKKIIIPVTENGVIDLNELDRLLSENSGKKLLVSVMLANNETGIIQPIKQVVKIAKKYNAFVHSDAIQAFGKTEVDLQDIGIDMMTISSHKIYGAQGAAALILKKNIILSPQIIGGAQEQNFRAGTENLPAIAGFAKAAENIVKNDNVRVLRDHLESQIKKIAPEAVIFGQKNERLPNTSFISMPNVSSETQLIHFDINGVDVSAGSACSSGKIEPSHVLTAMKVDSELANNVIRVSLSKNNKLEDVEYFTKKWQELYFNVNSKVMQASFQT